MAGALTPSSVFSASSLGSKAAVRADGKGKFGKPTGKSQRTQPSGRAGSKRSQRQQELRSEPWAGAGLRALVSVLSMASSRPEGRDPTGDHCGLRTRGSGRGLQGPGALVGAPEFAEGSCDGWPQGLLAPWFVAEVSSAQGLFTRGLTSWGACDPAQGLTLVGI